MDISRMKDYILDLAIRGKLVEQDNNDESANELLKKIEEGKIKLIEEGKIRKEKILKEIIEEEKIFEIPNNWKWVRIQDIITIMTDYVANGSFASLKENVATYKTENFALLIKTQDFGNNFTTDLTYIDKKSYEFLKKSKLFGGELMLSNIGASIGKVFTIPRLDKPMSLAPNAMILKFENDFIREYFKIVFKSPLGQKYLKDLTAGTAMPKFSKTDLKPMCIPLPPLEEQKRIVSKVEELFVVLDNLDKEQIEYNKLLEILKNKTLDLAIRGKLIENNLSIVKLKTEEEKDNIPFNIPQNWIWLKFSKAFCLKQGIQIDVGEQSIIKDENHQLQFLRIIDFTQNNNNIRYVNKKYENYLIKENELAMVRYGAAGFVCLGKEGVLANNLFKITPKFKAYIKYVYFLLKSEYFQNKIITQTVALPAIKFATLNSILIPLPPLEEQKIIVKKIEEIFNIIAEQK